jgi:hydrogenase maturation protease
VAETLVIGYGSPIRGDDAVGPLAADRLADMALGPGITVLARHILTADLVPDIAAARRVVFIDAAASGRPGEIRRRPLAPNRDALSSMAHFLDPGELLAWTQALCDQVPEAYLVTMTGADFDYAAYELTATAQECIGRLIQQVLDLVLPERTDVTA